MRKLLLILVVILSFATAKAQNPFAEYGYTPKIATLSQGQYNEFFDNDSIVQIGSVLFNTKSKQIVAFVETDTLYSEATLEPDIVSRWISPDPLASERPSWSPYNFCSNNPIIRIDPDGRLDDIVITGENNSSVTLKTDMIDIKVNASSLGVNFGGNYTLQGEDVLNAGLDIVGVFDPTGISDGIGAKMAFDNGDYLSAGISALGVIPYVGDIAKVGKIGKDVKIIDNAIDALKVGRSGKQEKLRELVSDTKLGKSDKGWIKQEMNQIDRGKRTNIRNPPGKNLAHERGREAAKGYSYKHSNLQNKADHKTQHKYDNNGKSNQERPVK